jgi:hypothetical protein
VNFQVLISEADYRELGRLQVALGKLIANVQLVPDAPQSPQTPGPVPPTHPAPHAHSTSTVPVRDRWARDRKGNEAPNPKDCYTVDVHVFKAVRDDVKSSGVERMKIAFDSPTGQGSVDASCWDDRLFPFLMVAAKEPKATLHIVKNGKYLNVVGIRA